MSFARLPRDIAIAPPLVGRSNEGATTRGARDINPSGARPRPDVAVTTWLLASRTHQREILEKNVSIVL